MIKSLDTSNNNAYRILKVLTNQDFLAIDYFSNFYILSPLLNRTKLDRIYYNNKEKIITSDNTENHILEPIQIIDIDSIAYSVFHVGKSEVYFLKSADQLKRKRDGLIINLFSDSIHTILKHLLVFKAKELKKYLSPKNFVIIGDAPYLLLISREKEAKLSLKRSERSSSKSFESNRQNPLNRYLNNEVEIVRQFGLVLWQCFYQRHYPLVQEADNCTFVSAIIQDMIKEKITFQYLYLKVSQINRVKRSLKFKIFDKNQRFKTEPLQAGQKRILKPLDSQKLIKFQAQSIGQKTKTPISQKRPKISFHKRLLTSNQNYQANKLQNRSQKSKLTLFHNQENDLSSVPRQSFRKKMMQRSQKEKQRYRDWLTNHDFQTSFRERVKKQGQIARQKFRKSVQSNHSEQETSRVVDENTLKAKLMLKLKNFKTSFKKDVKQLPLLSNIQHSLRQVTVESERVENRKQIQKRLLFSQIRSSQRQESANIQPIQTIANQTSRLDAVQVRQLTKNYSQSQRIQNINKVNHNLQTQLTSEQSKLPFEEIKDKSQVKQKTNNSQLLKHNEVKNKQEGKTKVQQVKQLVTKVQQYDKNTQENTKQRTKQGFQVIQIVEAKVSNKKPIQNIQSDEIQQIHIGTLQPNINAQKLQKNFKKQHQNNYLTENKISKSKSYVAQPTTSSVKYDSLEQSFQQFLTVINILGNVCVKSAKLKQKLEKLQWRKSIYFIYQRFCYERQNIVKSFSINACQTFRRNRKISYDHWQQWLKSKACGELQQRLAKQNAKIRQDLNKFSITLLQTNKLSRRVDFYVRNRQKILDSGDRKTRIILSKFAVDQIVQLYNFIAQKNMVQPEIISFIWDCLYALKIIAELDNYTDQSKWVKINQYQSYSLNFEEICRELETLYSLYFSDETAESSFILKV